MKEEEEEEGSEFEDRVFLAFLAFSGALRELPWASKDFRGCRATPGSPPETSQCLRGQEEEDRLRGNRR